MTSALSTATNTEPVWERIWRETPDAEKDRAQLQREANSKRWRRLAECLTDHFGQIKDLRTIELGAGRGDVSVLLAQAGARVTLVDFCDKALAKARQRFEGLGLSAQYLRSDILGDVSVLRRQFDVSLSVGVVEHFRRHDRSRAIATHAAVLRPAGVAMISVPNAWCAPYRAWKAYLRTRGWWPYGLEIPYSRRELRNRARHAGLTPIQMFAESWWRSICEHWGRGVFHRSWPGTDRKSWLDRWGYDLSVIGVKNQ